MHLVKISAVNMLLALVAGSCLTHCNPMGCNPPVSSVYGIPQARILEWVTIPFSRASGFNHNYSLGKYNTFPAFPFPANPTSGVRELHPEQIEVYYLVFSVFFTHINTCTSHATLFPVNIFSKQKSTDVSSSDFQYFLHYEMHTLNVFCTI